MESTPGVGTDTAPGVLDEPGPCEIPDTISTACSSFVAKRLTNPAEQQYIGRLLPDMLSSVTAALPTLHRPKALVIGDTLYAVALAWPGERVTIHALGAGSSRAQGGCGRPSSSCTRAS